MLRRVLASHLGGVARTRSTQDLRTLNGASALKPTVAGMKREMSSAAPSGMVVADTVLSLRKLRATWEAEHIRAAGEAPIVALVPTMGSLHAGHLDLVRRARERSDRVVASIFVNPKQFAPGEDYDEYVARTADQLALDTARLQEAGVDALFAPPPAEMYPTAVPTRTRVVLDGVDELAEGAARPGFFGGVATVVTSLFNVATPTHAYFGQKDALQCIVVRQLARDLHMNVRVLVCPTVREADGLAMSSRNVRLTAEQRAAAPHIYRTLRALQDAFVRGGAGSASGGPVRAGELARMGTAMLATEPLFHVEYVSVADATTGAELDPHAPLEAQHTAADGSHRDAAYLVSTVVRVGEGEAATRLLDNVVLSGRGRDATAEATRATGDTLADGPEEAAWAPCRVVDSLGLSVPFIPRIAAAALTSASPVNAHARAASTSAGKRGGESGAAVPGFF